MDLYADISRKVLFVDDEILLLEGIKRQLRRELDITVALGGETGLAVLTDQGPFAVVVSDYNMQGMDGIDFLNAVYQKYPQTVLIMLTGRAELDIAVNALHKAHISRFLNKPCSKEMLLETLQDGLEQYRLRQSEQILQAELHRLNQHLEERVRQKTRALQVQYEYVANMTEMSNPEAIIKAFMSAIRELTQLDKLTLWLSPQVDGHFACHYPLNTAAPTFQTKTCPAGVIAKILADKELWMRLDISETGLSDFDKSLFNGQPFMALALHSKRGVLGILNLAGEKANLDSDLLEALIGMTDVTATALENHWHREAFDDAQDAIITALAKLSEYRDPETGAHLLRLKKYSALICGYLAETEKFRSIVTAEFTQDLVRSSPLHDIGKVGIPDAILKKPGKLTAEEFEIMKTHAEIGGDTLRSVYEQYPSQSFIKCGMEIAYGHHEKWNGSGYPLGLQGESIPLAARILALVDVYDALTCRRVYKPPFSREQAKTIIIEGNGNHFDPDIVDAFLNNEAEFNSIAEQFADIV